MSRVFLLQQVKEAFDEFSNDFDKLASAGMIKGFLIKTPTERLLNDEHERIFHFRCSYQFEKQP